MILSWIACNSFIPYTKYILMLTKNWGLTSWHANNGVIKKQNWGYLAK